MTLDARTDICGNVPKVILRTNRHQPTVILETKVTMVDETKMGELDGRLGNVRLARSQSHLSEAADARIDKRHASHHAKRSEFPFFP